ncbi:hypothetical protein CHS0354_016592 [Potamilus streckersoni]|uniref:Uncharacterized protein n=1 Tax=Potamilus streckersoni TaxID=2493646 RepID=A0AAE0TKS6_9BIVA|nr:hypothetical protein CHS0354_016592 [Potamilus streckersoni]
MMIGACLLILSGCMPYLIRFGYAIGYPAALPYGGVGSYGYGGDGGTSFSPLLLLLALPLLFGFGGGAGGTDTVIVSEDTRTRITNILIRRSTLTGTDLAAYKEQIAFCTAANKDQAGCTLLGATCSWIANDERTQGDQHEEGEKIPPWNELGEDLGP